MQIFINKPDAAQFENPHKWVRSVFGLDPSKLENNDTQGVNVF